MGKRHRERRKVLKGVLRRFGVRETEFGELKRQVSKAEVRRQLLRKQEIQNAILDSAMKRAREEIFAQEDARVFSVLESAMG